MTDESLFWLSAAYFQCPIWKSYIPSTINIDCKIWHLHEIVAVYLAKFDPKKLHFKKPKLPGSTCLKRQQKYKILLGFRIVLGIYNFEVPFESFLCCFCSKTLWLEEFQKRSAGNWQLWVWQSILDRSSSFPPENLLDDINTTKMKCVPFSPLSWQPFVTTTICYFPRLPCLATMPCPRGSTIGGMACVWNFESEEALYLVSLFDLRYGITTKMKCVPFSPLPWHL